MRAQYLLRFDDICPGMNWDAWDRIEQILAKNGIAPLLAVIPDNQDPVLEVRPPDPSFWARVREWQARGWTIGMHGWQHRFVTVDAGILRMNRFSEFAGLPRAEQECKLRCGQEVFEREGIESTVWIAPAHSFDTVTVEILNKLGFRYISDGFWLLPHVDSLGITWIPQQLWTFRWRPFGVWTICFHINGWTSAELSAFEKSVLHYRDLISDFTTIVNRYAGRGKTRFDLAAGRIYRSLAAVNSAVKQFGPKCRFEQ